MGKSEYKCLCKGLGFIAGILFILSGCHSSNLNNLQSEVDLIAARFVPDHRVGICNIKILPGENGAITIAGETTNRTAKNEIIKTLNKYGKKIIDSIICLPDTLRNERYMGLVSLSVVNLRKEPDHASELVSQAILGTPVLVLKENDSWLLIQTPDNYIAWTKESSIELMSSKEMAHWKKSDRVIYIENTGWLKDTCSPSAGVVGDLVGGSIMEKTGESDGYVRIVLPDGRKGFAEKQKVLDFAVWKSTVTCTEESICKVAMTYMGLPYLWGGSSTKGVDCSGFVESVCFRNGLIMARDASLQALYGITVDVSDGFTRLRKGDLLFFGSKKNGISHVTHVAIYIGSSEYINSSGRVMVNSLDSEQINYSRARANSLLAAKRIIGVANDPGIVPVSKHPWY